ncbi:exosome complex RNA-binding protein Rrp42 [Candidatus Mancarchaeum acidiphilum]|uniref:Exosome complex RNA-binding protein Rrp42 n=2 Tax=Candidatus Mancarchaeum acidiphilum TaxID=1920749 RepID=A0A218NLN6_9ARCH|nr:exosome complex RNA-binding protein Rrp42 [Candidatus Mancarchaeum acidiphilum]
MDAMSKMKSNYVKKLSEEGKREDSRDAFSFREIKITKGIIEHAEGSAQVDIGDTRVIAGVKMVVESPHDDTPNEGNLIVSVTILPMAATEYESGPPSPEEIELSRVTDRGIRSAVSIDPASLFIEEGKVWSVYVDVYVLNYSGNMLDAASIAAMAALTNARVPEYKDGSANYEKRDKKLSIKNVVTSTTFAKIGDSLFLDANENEESAMNARLTIQVDDTQIRAMQKGLSGSFTMEEINKLIDISFDKHKELKGLIIKE